MDAFPIPFPCTIDIGLLRVEVGRRCVVLKRRDREFPHITLFYERKRGRDYWWPHVTWRDRGGRERREELGRLRLEHGHDVEQRFKSIVHRRFEEVVVLTDVAKLGEDDWIVIMPTLKFVASMIDLVLVGKRVLSLERLGTALENREQALRLIHSMLDCAVDPRQLVYHRPTGPLAALRLKDDVIEQRWLYGYDLGDARTAWFMAPANILGMQPDELMRAIVPRAFDTMRRIGEVLEIPLELPAEKVRA